MTGPAQPRELPALPVAVMADQAGGVAAARRQVELLARCGVRAAVFTNKASADEWFRVEVAVSRAQVEWRRDQDAAR